MPHIEWDAVARRLVLAGLDDGVPLVAETTDPVKVESVSVSQLNEKARCSRRWFLRKVRRIKVPTEHKSGANTGTEIHAEHDHYYKRGFVIKGSKHEKKTRASLESLPPCGPDVTSEMPFALPIEVGAQRLSFNGVIDLVDKAFLPALLKITDHKSTSNIAKLEAEPVDVYNDPQMLTYAHVGYTLFNPARVEVAHNTISSKHVARIIPPVYVHVPRQKAEENWADQLRAVGNMIKLASAPPADWNDVAGNPNACSDYGGCDFLPVCTLKNPSLGVPPMSHDSDAASALLARLNALPGAVTAPKPSPPPVVDVPILPGELAKFSGAPVTLEAPAELVETGEIRLTVDEAALRKYEEVQAMAEAVALLPPDAPSRMTPAAEEKPAAAKKGRPKKSVEALPGNVLAPVRYQHRVDKMLDTVDNLAAALDAHGEDGWELVGFFDGLWAVFKRPVL